MILVNDIDGCEGCFIVVMEVVEENCVVGWIVYCEDGVGRVVSG